MIRYLVGYVHYPRGLVWRNTNGNACSGEINFKVRGAAMKIITKCQIAACVAALVFNVTASAYSDDKPEEYCKKPKFTDLSFKTYSEPEKAEIAPGVTLKFRVSEYADPGSLVVTAKNQVLPTTIESTSTFHQVSFTLPAALKGSFVRINASVKAVLKCETTEGWLVKIAEQ